MGDIRICIDNIRMEMSCVQIDVSTFELVAGVGFEPTFFRL